MFLFKCIHNYVLWQRQTLNMYIKTITYIYLFAVLMFHFVKWKWFIEPILIKEILLPLCEIYSCQS
jgi:hypothetical protein